MVVAFDGQGSPRSRSRTASLLLAVLFVAGLFAVPPAQAAGAVSLKFTVPPANVGAGEAFTPAIQVAAVDGSNAVDAGASGTVTLAITTWPPCPTAGPPARPCGVLLQGPVAGKQSTVTASLVSGIATFSNVRIDTIGKGYVLTATAAGLTSVASAPFDVQSGAAWPQFHKDSRHTAATVFSAAMTTPTAMADLVVTTPGAGATRAIGSSPLIVDLDRDGLMDIVAVTDFSNTASGTPGVRAMRQSPAGAFTTLWLSSGIAGFTNVKDGHATLAAGDLDGDQWPEVVLYFADFTDGGAGGFLGPADQIRVLNGQTGAQLAAWAPPFMLTTPIAPTIGDVNGDGKNDIVVLTMDATSGGYGPEAAALYVLDYAAGAISIVANAKFPQVAVTTGVLTGTYNQFASAAPALAELRSAHDGLEIVLGTDDSPDIPAPPNGRVYIVTVVGSTITFGEVVSLPGNQQAGTGDQVKGLAVADLDGDGVQEIAVNAGFRSGTPTQTPSLFVVKTAAALSGASLVTSPAADSYLWNAPALGDVDGDGKPDIANVKASADSADSAKQGDVTIRGYTGSIVDKGTLARVPAPPATNTESPGGGALADLNYVQGATPTLEFAFGSLDKTLAVSRGATPPTAFWATPPVTSGAGTSPMALGDLNGDCRPELLVGMDNGSLAAFKGTNAVLPSPPSFTTPTAFNTVAPWAFATSKASPGGDTTTPLVQAKLAWNVPTDGGLPIIDYRVYRGTGASGGAGTPVTSQVGVWRGATPPSATAITDFFTDDLSVAGENDYYYQVTAVTCFGEGLKSGYFYAEVKKPQAPTALTASQLTPSSVKLDWTAPINTPGGIDRPGGCGLKGDALYGFVYKIYWKASAGVTTADTLLGTTLPGILTYTHSPTSGTNYYRVLARNCVGDSVLSNEVSITLTSANSAPVITVPAAAQTMLEDNAVTFSTANSNLISVADADSDPSPLRMRLAVGKGTLTLATVTGLSFACGGASPGTPSIAACVGDGTADATMIFEGKQADIDAALDGMQFTPAADKCAVGTFTTLTANVDDLGNTGTGGAKTDQRSVTLKVTCVNDAPSFVAADPPSVAQDAGAQTVIGWASAISPGPAIAGDPGDESSQQLVFSTAVITNAALFAVAPSVAQTTSTAGPFTAVPWGDLTYTSATGLCGQATFRVTLTDNGASVAPDVNSYTPATDFTLTVSCPNDKPTFDDNGSPAAISQSGTSTVVSTPAWAYNIKTGVPASEANQQMRFKVVFASGSSTLLMADPIVSKKGGEPGCTMVSPSYCPGPFTAANGWGDLSYTIAANECGLATYTITLIDDGTMTPPPDSQPATSIDHSLAISVACVNQAPHFNAANPPTVREDNLPGAGPVTVAGWATGITAGNAGEDATQTVKFTVTVVTNPGLFAMPPAVSPTLFTASPFSGGTWGDLTYTLAQDQCGTARFRVTLTDSGMNVAPAVNLYTPADFAITATCVNDAPVFVGLDQELTQDAGPQLVAAWATGIAPARATATDELWGAATQQHLVFTTTVTGTSAGLTFTTPPSVVKWSCPMAGCNGPYDAANGWGDLTYEVKKGTYGTADVKVCLRDDGGNANGGVDTTCDTFTIWVRRDPNARDSGPHTDNDNDGIEEAADNCPSISNHDQTDSDHDGIGDACETDAPAPPQPGPEPVIPNESQPGDWDSDGIIDRADDCPDIPNRDQADLDRDGVGDACDTDVDGDAVPDDGPTGALRDNCPALPNKDQADANGDGVGDACQRLGSSGRSVPAGATGAFGNAGATPTSSAGSALPIILIAALGTLAVAGVLFFALWRRRHTPTGRPS
ncbi:MAG: FG-GAP-like repeat-containing protein [bacterium]